MRRQRSVDGIRNVLQRGDGRATMIMLNVGIPVPFCPSRRRHEAAAAEEPIGASVVPLFPVSASFNPPFTVMTHLVGQGDMQVRLPAQTPSPGPSSTHKVTASCPRPPHTLAPSLQPHTLSSPPLSPHR